MMDKDPNAPPKPFGKRAVACDSAAESDQRAAMRRMQDALEDDEVREALRSLRGDQTVQRKR
jgi:hypothetical protein